MSTRKKPWRRNYKLELDAVTKPGSLHPAVRQSPRQRLETALGCIRNARVRLKIRRIAELEMPTALVFWDEQERQVELIANDWEIIIRERDDTGYLLNEKVS